MTQPRISIIVPSLNQAEFIEQTLRSALDQNYPALELLVFDAGSSDGTLDILRRYAPQLAHWESKTDRGQSHAINKGLALATGDVWAYLNSDDLLTPGSLARVAELFADPAVNWIGGVSTIFDEKGDCGHVTPEAPGTMKDVLTPWNRAMQHVFPCSNVCFMRREIYAALGGFDESYHYSMDMEYYTRALFAGFTLRRLPEVLGRWRWHDASKTVRDGRSYRFLEEELRIANTYGIHLPPAERAQITEEIAHHTKWCTVRRALSRQPHASRWARLRSLALEAWENPSLLSFRPWLGAVKQQLLPQ